MDIRILKSGIEVWAAVPGMPEVEVKLRYLAQDAFDTIRTKVTAYRLTDGAVTPEADHDDAAFRSALARAVVQEWRGLTEDGAPFPCTPENIELLMTKWTEFRVLVMSTPLSLSRMIAARREESEKNFSATSESAPTSPA